MHDAFVTLVSALDVPQVVSAGQNDDLPPLGIDPTMIRTYPALLGASEVRDITVVSSVDKDGVYEAGSRYSEYSIASLGDGAECAKSSGGDYYIEAGPSPGNQALQCPSTYPKLMDAYSYCSGCRPSCILHGPRSFSGRLPTATLR